MVRKVGSRAKARVWNCTTDWYGRRRKNGNVTLYDLLDARGAPAAPM